MYYIQSKYCIKLCYLFAFKASASFSSLIPNAEWSAFTGCIHGIHCKVGGWTHFTLHNALYAFYVTSPKQDVT
jgi:hypothetical protein